MHKISVAVGLSVRFECNLFVKRKFCKHITRAVMQPMWKMMMMMVMDREEVTESAWPLLEEVGG